MKIIAVIFGAAKRLNFGGHKKCLRTFVFGISFFISLTAGVTAAHASDSSEEAQPREFAHEAPRIRAMLEYGWAAEKGIGQLPNAALAASLYCEAAKFSSAEAHYRAGTLYATGPLRDAALAMAFFSAALELGREQTAKAIESLQATAGRQKVVVPHCLTDDEMQIQASRTVVAQAKVPQFNFEGYLVAMSLEKRAVAALLIKHAPAYGVDTHLALAIAGVESNFDAQATSPKKAMGVMQLIPETAARFRVKNPYDAEENVRGGLAYLRWLGDFFRGDLTRVIAAYNAGEGAVMKYNGVPPYAETRSYVKRVLSLAQRKE